MPIRIRWLVSILTIHKKREKFISDIPAGIQKGCFITISKEESESNNSQAIAIPRKYFSGGETFIGVGDMAQIVTEQTMDSADAVPIDRQHTEFKFGPGYRVIDCFFRCVEYICNNEAIRDC